MKPFFLACILGLLLSIATPSDGFTSSRTLPIEGKEIQALARKIASHMDDGLQLGDLVYISEEIDTFLHAHFTLSTAQKREVIRQALCYVVDYTDTPYLPDAIFDPVFKGLIPDLVNALFPSEKHPPSLQSMLIDDKTVSVEQIITSLAEEAEKGLTATNLPSFIVHVIQITDTFFSLASQERGDIIKMIVDKVIDKTDTPFLPDTIFDPLFKSLAHEIIDCIIRRQAV